MRSDQETGIEQGSTTTSNANNPRFPTMRNVNNVAGSVYCKPIFAPTNHDAHSTTNINGMSLINIFYFLAFNSDNRYFIKEQL